MPKPPETADILAQELKDTKIDQLDAAAAEALAERVNTVTAVPNATELSNMLSHMQRQDVIDLAEVLIERAFIENTSNHSSVPLNLARVPQRPIGAYADIAGDLSSIPPNASRIYYHEKRDPKTNVLTGEICVTVALKDSSGNVVIVKSVYPKGSAPGEVASKPKAVMIEPLIFNQNPDSYNRTLVGPFKLGDNEASFDNYFFGDATQKEFLKEVKTIVKLPWYKTVPKGVSDFVTRNKDHPLTTLWNDWDSKVSDIGHARAAAELKELTKRIQLAYSGANRALQDKLATIAQDRAAEMDQRVAGLEKQIRNDPNLTVVIKDPNTALDNLTTLYADAHQVEPATVKDIFKKIRTEKPDPVAQANADLQVTMAQELTRITLGATPIPPTGLNTAFGGIAVALEDPLITPAARTNLQTLQTDLITAAGRLPTISNIITNDVVTALDASNPTHDQLGRLRKARNQLARAMPNHPLLGELASKIQSLENILEK